MKSLVRLRLAIVCPPYAVYKYRGWCWGVLVSVILTIFGFWIAGMIHALLITKNKTNR